MSVLTKCLGCPFASVIVDFGRRLTVQSDLGSQGSSVSASTSQKVLIPASSVASGGQVRSSGSLGATQLGSLHTGTLISTGGTSMQNAFVVVPAQYVTQVRYLDNFYSVQLCVLVV